MNPETETLSPATTRRYFHRSSPAAPWIEVTRAWYAEELCSVCLLSAIGENIIGNDSFATVD